MLRRFRNIILVFLLIVLAVGISSASAAATTLPGCNNPADSAFNQYCDSVPSATGSQRPQAGAPALGTALPSRTVRQIGRAQGGKVGSAHAGPNGRAAADHARVPHALLTLPAPGRRHALSTNRASIPSAWSLPLWMILVLVAVALALLGIAVVRWRTRRSGTPE